MNGISNENLMIDLPPSNNELAIAIEQLFQTAHQSAVFEYWSMVCPPILRKLKEHDISDAGELFSNAFLENSLLLIRKTAEFFKKKENNDRNDTLYAYRYLPDWNGNPVVGENEYKELHKRVGHITIRETRYGQIAWEVQSMIIQSIKTWLEFFDKVGESPVFARKPPTEQLQDYRATLTSILEICIKRQNASFKPY